MAAYLVADADWKEVDTETRLAFVQAVNPIITKYGGTPLVPARTPERVEGDWTPEIFTIVAFPDADTIRQMLRSPEYQDAAAFRRNAGAVFNTILVEGV